LLIARARGGDREATELLVRRHLPAVYNLTARILSDRDLAEDAAQDALVNALGALHRFRGESSFRTWILRIALNAARTIGRRKGRRREVEIDQASHLALEVDDSIDRLTHSAEARKIEELLPRLPEKQRLSVILRLQQGLSYAEVGEALDCSEGAARVNYHLGIKKLREWLS
jgi:RNA polymerase sigma-70 factor (ECF subfamily)